MAPFTSWFIQKNQHVNRNFGKGAEIQALKLTFFFSHPWHCFCPSLMSPGDPHPHSKGAHHPWETKRKQWLQGKEPLLRRKMLQWLLPTTLSITNKILTFVSHSISNFIWEEQSLSSFAIDKETVTTKNWQYSQTHSSINKFRRNQNATRPYLEQTLKDCTLTTLLKHYCTWSAYQRHSKGWTWTITVPSSFILIHLTEPSYEL